MRPKSAKELREIARRFLDRKLDELEIRRSNNLHANPIRVLPSDPLLSDLERKLAKSQNKKELNAQRRRLIVLKRFETTRAPFVYEPLPKGELKRIKKDVRRQVHEVLLDGSVELKGVSQGLDSAREFLFRTMCWETFLTRVLLQFRIGLGNPPKDSLEGYQLERVEFLLMHLQQLLRSQNFNPMYVFFAEGVLREATDYAMAEADEFRFESGKYKRRFHQETDPLRHRLFRSAARYFFLERVTTGLKRPFSWDKALVDANKLENVFPRKSLYTADGQPNEFFQALSTHFRTWRVRNRQLLLEIERNVTTASQK